MQYWSRCNMLNSFGIALLFRYIYKGRLVKISENIAFLFYKQIYMKYLILYYKTEILLKVALSTINQTINHKSTTTFHEISYSKACYQFIPLPSKKKITQLRSYKHFVSHHFLKYFHIIEKRYWTCLNQHIDNIFFIHL
jgi:hypothetical protein